MTKDLSKAKMQQALLRPLFFFIRPGLNTDIYGVNLRIQSKYRKKRTRNQKWLRIWTLKNPTDKNKPLYTIKEIFLRFWEKKKEIYFTSLSKKYITHDRKFWHTVKPFLSDKIKSRESIILVEQKKEDEAENSLNGFFTNIGKYLEILAYNVADTFHHNFSNHPAWQATTKYRNHPSIDSIKSHFKHNANLFFSKVDKNTVLKKI